MESALARLSEDAPPPATPLPAPRLKVRRAKDPTFDVRAALHALLGVDLTQIHGLGPSVAFTLVGECGTDMSRWPTAKHFTSWLALAPGNTVSGGKVLSSKTRRSANRAAVGLRLAAVAVGKTDTALGAFYRRPGARAGKAKAVTATARKLGVLFYNTLRHGMEYADPGASHYEARYRQRAVASLRRRAKSLGLRGSLRCRGGSFLGVQKLRFLTRMYARFWDDLADARVGLKMRHRPETGRIQGLP